MKATIIKIDDNWYGKLTDGRILPLNHFSKLLVTHYKRVEENDVVDVEVDNNYKIINSEYTPFQEVRIFEPEPKQMTWNEIFEQVDQYESLADHLIKNYHPPRKK